MLVKLNTFVTKIGTSGLEEILSHGCLSNYKLLGVAPASMCAGINLLKRPKRNNFV